MKAIEKIESLLAFTLRNRRTGTTTLIQNIAKENDIYVIASRSEYKNKFGDSAITIEEMAKAQGKSPKPYLIDNDAFRLLLISCETELLNKDFEIAKLKSKLSSIQEILNK